MVVTGANGGLDAISMGSVMLHERRSLDGDRRGGGRSSEVAQPLGALSGSDAATATFTAPDSLTEDVALTFSLKVTDAAGLYHEDTVSVTVVAPSNALTAAFENAPSSHDGSTGFTVGLRFSEEVSLSYTAFTRGLLTVAGGTVVSARRLAPPSNVGWEVSVSPSGNDDVVVTLPADRACGASRRCAPRTTAGCRPRA